MKDLACTIPLPIQVVIDDVGWWNGRDGSADQDPYRTGFVRDHVPADYAAIVELGRVLNIRPVAAMILGEWDTDNRLRSIPSASREGAAWDNSRWVGPWMEEAAEILRTHSEYIELGLHGLCHEYWQDGRFTRGEWLDERGVPRPIEVCGARLDLYAQLLDRHKLGPFPRTLVPPAFVWSYRPSDTALTDMLSREGIRYVSTDFDALLGVERLGGRPFAVDENMLLLGRNDKVCAWDAHACRPEGGFDSPCCCLGLHWPNLLHPDPERNDEVIRRWVSYLASIGREMDRLLAPDMAAAASQLLYRELTHISASGEGLTLDFTDVATPEYDAFTQPIFELRIRATPTARFEGEGITVEQQTWSDEGYHRLTVRPLSARGQLRARTARGRTIT